MLAPFVILGWGLLIATGCMDSQPKEPGLNVHCATSVHGAVQRAAEDFTKRTGTPVRLHTGASSTLASQILRGAKSDLFISANRTWLATLENKGLIGANDVHLLAANRIVLAAKANSGVTWTPETPLTEAFRGRLAIGNPDHVPLGMYARDALENTGQWAGLQERLLPAQNSSAAVAYILNGHAGAGIIYQTDLMHSTDLTVVHAFDAPQPGVWSGAFTSGKGAEFVRFLTSTEGQKHFDVHGFVEASKTVSKAEVEPHSPSAIEEVVSLSLRVALLAVLFILPFGIFFGWLLARREFPGKALLNALIHVPLVLPPVVTGYLLLWCFGQHGPLSDLNLAFTWTGAALASAIVAFPLFVRATRLGFEAIDPKIEQAALTLGAHPMRVFFRVSLPLCLGAIISGALLSFGRSLGEFGATITFAGSVMGETETLPLAIYTALQSPTGHETVATLALVSTVLAFGTLMLGEWMARRVQWQK